MSSKRHGEEPRIIWFESRRKKDQREDKSSLSNGNLTIYDDLMRCVNDLRQMKNEKILLICSGDESDEFLLKIADCPSIEEIFIYDTLIDHVPKLGDAHGKLRGVFLQWKELIEAIENGQTSRKLRRPKRLRKKNLNEKSIEFRWFQLFSYVICQYPRDLKAKDEMLNACRKFYRNNEEIEQFDRSYQDETDAIEWYSKDSFLRRLIDHLFQSEDLEELYHYRLFLGDLTRSIDRQFRHHRASYSEQSIVYSASTFSSNEFEQFKMNLGQYYSINGFLLASFSSDAARKSLKSKGNTSSISVLFQIICDLNEIDDEVKFATIRRRRSNDDEILFDLNTTFFVESIEEENDFRVTMRTSKREQSILHPLIEETSNEIKEMGAKIVYGRLILSKGFYDKALNYFLQLFDQRDGDVDRAWIEFNLGRCYRFQGQFDKAKEFYHSAYQRMITEQPKRIKDSARILRNHGQLLHDQANYDQALDFYRQALEIQQTFLPSNHRNIAFSLIQIGSIFHDEQLYPKALSYYHQALNIQDESLPHYHLDRATLFSHMAKTFQDQGDFNRAFDFYFQALDIREKLLPFDHPDLAFDLIQIGNIYQEQARYELASDYYENALEIQEKSLSKEHWHRGLTLVAIGDLLTKQNKYYRALAFYRDALEILQRSLHLNHPEIASTLAKLATVLHYQGKSDEALEGFQQALERRKTFLSADHPLIADLYHSLGQCYVTLGKSSHASRYYHDALKIYEHSLPAHLCQYERVQENLRELSAKTKH